MLNQYCLIESSYYKNLHDDFLVPSAQAAVGMAAYLPFNSLANEMTRRTFHAVKHTRPSVSLARLYAGYPRVASGFAASTVLQTAVNNHLMAYAGDMSPLGTVIEPLVPCIAGVVSAPLSAVWEAYAAHVGGSRLIDWKRVARLSIAPIAVREAIFSYSYLSVAQQARQSLQDAGIDSPLGAAITGGAAAGALGAIVSQPVSEVARLVQNAHRPMSAVEASLLLVTRMRQARSIMPLYQTALPRTCGMLAAVAAMELTRAYVSVTG